MGTDRQTSTQTRRHINILTWTGLRAGPSEDLMVKKVASSSLLLKNKVRVEKGSVQNRGLVTKEGSVTDSVT